VIAYKSVPFYLTNRNYGVLVDHLDHVSYEVQSDKLTQVQMSVPGETLRIFIFVGSSPKDVLSKYTLFTGRPPLPPDWSYGLWLSTSFLTDYDEKTVTGHIDRMAELDIPLNVFHFDCFWMRAHTWCDFQFDPKFFPDPRGFLDRLHQRGLKVCVWINPWVGQASRLFEEGDANGYFVKRKNGSTFQTNTWQPGCATVDFTNPDAKKWWQGYLAELLDIGVDSFKTDFGERITTEGVMYHDGSNPRTMHNA
jgi:alpha-D-xyloside xylohydrolase